MCRLWPPRLASFAPKDALKTEETTRRRCERQADLLGGRALATRPPALNEYSTGEGSLRARIIESVNSSIARTSTRS